MNAVTNRQRLIGRWIAGFFGVLGVGIVIAFAVTVLNNPRITNAPSNNRLILNFLDAYGLIIPFTVFGLGITFINFARRLFARDVITSGWAQLTLFWGTIFSLVIVVIQLFIAATSNIGGDAADRVPLNGALIGGLLGLALITGLIGYWLGQNRLTVYNVGEETITSRESLVAWNLLIPTVVIMILVAARPLERTFIASLTNRTFAGAQSDEVQFIGLQNYVTLLGFRIDRIDCVRDAADQCTTQTISSTVEDAVTLTVDLDSIAALEPTTLDVGLEFFQTATLNRLLAEAPTFAEALTAAAKAELEVVSGATVGTVTLVEVLEANIVQVTVDGQPQQVTVTERLSNLTGVDWSGVDLNYAQDVDLDGLNTYRIRSRLLREQFGILAEAAYNPQTDPTIDSVTINGFNSFNDMAVTVSRIVTRDEVIYQNPRDTVGEAYRNFSQVGRFNLYGNLFVLSARDADFLAAINNTLFFSVVTVVVELVLGMIIALTVHSEFPGRGLVRAAMLIPWAIPTVVSAKLWEYMLLDNRTGVINDVLVRLGVIESSISWLASADTRIWSLIFVDVWKTTPFMALLILAGLQTIAKDVYEAADVDGAGPIRQFFSITLPLLRPTLAVALVFRTLDAIRAFDVFEVLLGRQLQSMATYNQFVLVETQEFGYASAIGVTMFIIIMIFTIIYVQTLGVETE